MTRMGIPCKGCKEVKPPEKDEYLRRARHKAEIKKQSAGEIDLSNLSDAGPSRREIWGDPPSIDSDDLGDSIDPYAGGGSIESQTEEDAEREDGIEKESDDWGPIPGSQKMMCLVCGYVEIDPNDKKDWDCFDGDRLQRDTQAPRHMWSPVRRFLEGDIDAYLPPKVVKSGAGDEFALSQKDMQSLQVLRDFGSKEKNFGTNQIKRVITDPEEGRTLRSEGYTPIRVTVEKFIEMDDLGEFKDSKKRDNGHWIGIPKKKKRTSDMRSRSFDRAERWFARARAVKFLDYTKLAELESSDGFPWISELADKVIYGAIIPERSIWVGNPPTRMLPDNRGRALLELFIHMAHDEGSFWFISDYCTNTSLSKRALGRLLSQPHPFSHITIERCVKIHNDFNIAPHEVNLFARRVARNFGFDPNGIDKDDRILQINDLKLPIEIHKDLALRAHDSKTPFTPRVWVEYRDGEGVEKRREETLGDKVVEVSCGGLREVGMFSENEMVPGIQLTMKHIPVAYIVAQRIQDSWRGEKRRDYVIRLLEMIREDLEWCQASVEEMDEWWDSVVRDHPDPAARSVTMHRQ